MAINIRFGTKHAALSNLTPRPFTFQGVECGSMEGFLQSLKFSGELIQRQVCLLSGHAARNAGQKAEDWRQNLVLYWKGKEYKRLSLEYQNLIADAYLALFTQNCFASEALKQTRNETLTHTIGHTDPRETVLTRGEFIMNLTRIRQDLIFADLDLET